MKKPSTLKRLVAHPIFPNVRIVRAPVPYLMGSSQDLQTVYIDPRVPETINVNGKRVPTAAPLAVHELYERAAIHVLQEACEQAGHQAQGCDIYSLAHRDGGEEAEKRFLEEQYGFTEDDWQAYQRIMQSGVRTLAAEGPQGDPPPDLYTEMYAHAREAGIDQHSHHFGETGGTDAQEAEYQRLPEAGGGVRSDGAGADGSGEPEYGEPDGNGVGGPGGAQPEEPDRQA